MNIISSYKSLTKFERVLWLVSLALIVISFSLLTDRDPLALVASLIGAGALIFTAKGLPLGQVLIIIFALLYGIISVNNRYWGEFLTYVGMSLPMAVVALVSWIKHPYKEGDVEVEVARLSKKKIALLSVGAALATVIFYFILRYFDTPALIWSTLSITTSFYAAGLTYLRSPYYALAYAMNDIVLIVLWVIATVGVPSNFPMIICFAVFLVNDLYGFFSWQRMQRRQSADKSL